MKGKGKKANRTGNQARQAAFPGQEVEAKRLFATGSGFMLSAEKKQAPEEKQKDYESAIFWFRESAGLGNPDAQFFLGAMYDAGLGAQRDRTQARHWLSKAAQQGHAEATRSLMAVRKQEQAIVMKAAEGDAAAQFRLGCAYHWGDGVKQDVKKAVMWYSNAAAQGHTDAMFNLGMLYQQGVEVAQDGALAAQWYRKAAQQGMLEAQYCLARLLEEGCGTLKKDEKEAAEWYRKASAKDPKAANNLALMYASGRGVKQNHKEAAALLRQAAKRGHAVAEFNLGVAYLLGRGVTQSYDEARLWLGKAAAQGHEDARTCLATLDREAAALKDAAASVRPESEAADQKPEIPTTVLVGSALGVLALALFFGWYLITWRM